LRKNKSLELWMATKDLRCLGLLAV